MDVSTYVQTVKCFKSAHGTVVSIFLHLKNIYYRCYAGYLGNTAEIGLVKIVVLNIRKKQTSNILECLIIANRVKKNQNLQELRKVSQSG